MLAPAFAASFSVLITSSSLLALNENAIAENQLGVFSNAKPPHLRVGAVMGRYTYNGWST